MTDNEIQKEKELTIGDKIEKFVLDHPDRVLLAVGAFSLGVTWFIAYSCGSSQGYDKGKRQILKQMSSALNDLDHEAIMKFIRNFNNSGKIRIVWCEN